MFGGLSVVRCGKRAKVLGAVLMATTAMVGIVATPAVAQTASAQHNFAILAQPLPQALMIFGRQAGLQVTAEGGVTADKTSTAISGDLAPAEALSRLLTGTGLTFRFVGNNGVQIEPAPQSADGAIQLEPVRVEASGKALGSVTEGTGLYTTFYTSSSTRLNLTPQDTPQAITVLTRQRLEDQRLDTLIDALDATPGIIVQKTRIGEGQDGIDIYARGSRLRNYQIDGVSTSLDVAPMLANTVFYDRVEIVRGATGIMNGLGTPAATINLIRKRPTATPQKSIAAHAGNWARYGGSVDISDSLNESGTARVRAAANYGEEGAWVKNFDQKNLALYGITEFDLSDRTLLTLGFNHLDQKTDSPILGRPLFFTNGQRINLSPSDDGTPSWNYYDQKSTNLFASLEHRFGSNWIGKMEYSQSRYDFDNLTTGLSQTIDATTGNGMEVWPYRASGKNRQDNLDAYMSGVFSMFGRDHELIGGVTLSSRDSSVNYFDQDYTSWPTDFNIYDWTRTAPKPAFSQTSEGHFQERNYSAYLSARFQLSDATSLLLGGRGVHWKLDEGTRSRKENVLVPYVGLVHALNNTWSVYASYTKIFQPQDGVVYLYGRPGVSPDPEQGEGYEAGIKASLNGGRLTANLAVFQMDVANLAFWDPNVRYYEVHGETRTRGIEVEVNGELAEGWQASAGYAYARSEDGNGRRALARAPLHNFKLFTTYRLPGNWNKLTVGGGLNWQSAIHSGNTPNYTQKQYTLVNLMARYDVNQDLSVSFNLNNALNKRYHSTAINNYGTYGATRNFMVSTKYQF